MTLHPIVAHLTAVLGKNAVLAGASEGLPYDSDAYTSEKRLPLCTVLPSSTEEMADVVKVCNRHKVAFAPRGAGKGDGTLLRSGVLIGMARLNRILSVDIRNRRMVVQAGVVNTQISKAVVAQNLRYAPDPSSQDVATLSGNIANNAGGLHTLKYGVGVNHLLGLKVVLPTGNILSLGDSTEEMPGYDLPGLFCGAEGTLGIVTEAILRLPPPLSVRTLLGIFPTIEGATTCAGAIMSAGIIPAALELMNASALKTAEEAFHFGFPLDCAAILIIEIDGSDAGIERQADSIKAICAANGAREVRAASTPKERADLWASRKKAVGSLGPIKPSAVTQDGVMPCSKLPEASAEIARIGIRYDLPIANVFHAGDGNLHPAALHDKRDEDEVRRVIDANREILERSLQFGGSPAGEHGIGGERRDFMPVPFPLETLDMMRAIRQVFNPHGPCNADKILPVSHGCSYEITCPRGPVAV